MSVDVTSPAPDTAQDVLSEEALAFVGALHERFEPTRQELLAARAARRKRFADGENLDFLADTRGVREGDWQVAPAPADLQNRRVEITGPADRKMMINAFNSGASGFMVDLEDSMSPTWANVVQGQVNLTDAIERTIEFTGPDGREYKLNDEIATMLVRPRGWHLPEKHIVIDGTPVAGAFVDAGLHLFRNAQRLVDRGSGPYFYLPKMESHREARLWNDVFTFAEQELGLEHGTIKATVLIETLPAAFEMDEILYELRDHSAGLNAGRWDYIFSAIKTFRERPEFVLPDRADVKMTVPFMHAYTELLVKTCHKRGAHAMGGMAALIPSRKDEEANRKATEAVAADKQREAEAGFDGTWVAHPDVVATAMDEFDKVLGDEPNQVSRQRDDVDVSAADLLAMQATPGAITEQGLRNNVNVGIQYISSWLRGNGAAGIYGMMEDAATAEISRSQVWQWIRHGKTLEDGTAITPELVRRLGPEELEKVRQEIGDDEWFEREGRPDLSRELFEQVALADELPEFLTLVAYEQLD
jgi:malate synthase